MKIWNGYGSEHSMNLVLIGRFQQVRTAEHAENAVDQLRKQAHKDEAYVSAHTRPADQRYSDAMLKLITQLNLMTLAPTELDQLLSEYQLTRDGDCITVTTDEADVSAFLKVFIESGARVEVFSASVRAQEPPPAEQTT